jgi:hypothetical protein
MPGRHDPIAPFLPGLARRFPFFAALWTRREVSFRGGTGKKWGDCQMKIKGNGRSALILAAGLWICFAGPSQAVAAPNTAGASPTAAAPIALNKYTRHSSRHWRKYAHHKSSKVALKSTDDKDDQKAATTDVATGDAGKPSTPAPSSEMPPSVANANAQLAASESSTSDAAQAMSVRASNIVQTAANNPADTPPGAEEQVVAADQLNDVDRALHEGKAPVVPLATASAEPAVPFAAASVTAGSAARTSDSTWDQTSLIGKIFIGFGALLTMASAARMFMA